MRLRLRRIMSSPCSRKTLRGRGGILFCLVRLVRLTVATGPVFPMCPARCEVGGD